MISAEAKHSEQDTLLKCIEHKKTSSVGQVVQWNTTPDNTAPGTPMPSIQDIPASPAWDPASEISGHNEGTCPVFKTSLIANQRDYV